VDATKGIQTQTAECLVIGEVLCDHLLLVLNKLDLLPQGKQQAAVDKMTKRLRMALQNTKFRDCQIIPVAAKPGGEDADSSKGVEPIGVDKLIRALQDMFYVPSRNTEGPVVFSVDHCFSIRGQGTVMTGTVLQGALKVNEIVEIPSLNLSKKVKSIQMFKKSVEHIVQGDRAGVCVTQFDPKSLERGLACTPGLVRSAYAILALVDRISYYKLAIESKTKFHVSVGNQTVMAKVTFFGTSSSSSKEKFDYEKEYKFQDELIDINKSDDDYKPSHQYAVIQFDKCLPVLPGSFLIGSKLDMDVHTNMCRLAFKATTVEIYDIKDYAETRLPDVKVYKSKSREGIVERMQNDSEVIIKNLFKKDTNLQLFVGFKVSLSTGEEGVIEGHFGTSGKVKVVVREGLKPDTVSRLSIKKKGKETNSNSLASSSESIKVLLSFKKYVFAKSKKAMHQ